MWWRALCEKGNGCMRDPKQARSLLALAQSELHSLGNMLDREAFRDEFFGFHAQQVAEKAFKALLCLRGVQYDYTHDLAALYRDLMDAGEEELGLFQRLTALTDFAVHFRYEAFMGKPLDRREILADVTRLVELVDRRLRSVQPDEQA